MNGIRAYVGKGRHILRRWVLDPKIHTTVNAVVAAASGFALSAASLAGYPQPFAPALVCALSGWSAVLAAVGSAVGYLVFWGEAGQQALCWVGACLVLAVLLGDRRIARQMPLLLPATAALILAATGLIFQVVLEDTTPVAMYLLRVLLCAGGTYLFSVVVAGRNPVSDWLACALGVLALAQVLPIPYCNLGLLAAGALAVCAPFPAVALAGLALDLAQVTGVPMTGVMTAAFLVRLLPRRVRFGWLAPAGAYLLTMYLCKAWDLYPIVSLLLGAVGGSFLQLTGKATHRRGETGVAQVRLELAAEVLSQTEQLLLETLEVPVDEDALVARAAERACSGCPSRKGCKDARRLGQLPGPVLHKPLLSIQELPIICRKSGRFLAQLHRSQEQLRSIRADRERQREYRAAVVQQYQFLATYLQDLADRLASRTETAVPIYTPRVCFYGNRPEQENGDRCQRFAGLGGSYYVLLCDGMGTGIGAVQEAKTAGSLLRRLLCAGYPPEHAIRSLNSLCALRERAGAVTVDLAQLHLDTGRLTIYKWGAAPSYLLNRNQAERVGTAGPPPGLSVTDCRETISRRSMRRGEVLVMVSDGIGEEMALRCCTEQLSQPPEELARQLLTCCTVSGQEDATVITVQLELSN